MYRAKVGFSGAIIMKKNEVREIKDKKLVNDLLKAGYIEEYKSATPKELEQENATLKEDLKNALDTIKELNNKIAELTAATEPSDDGNTSGDGTPSDDGNTSGDGTPSDDGDTSDKENKK